MGPNRALHTTSPARDPSRCAGVSRKGRALLFAIIDGDEARLGASAAAGAEKPKDAEERASILIQ